MADARARADVSLVCTVRNEAGTVGALMESIAAQTVRPREVIVVDGGSRDGTQLHVEWWHGRLGCPLRLIERPGANIAAGRNIAIRAARAPLIAVTDAGTRLDPAWLASLIAPFDDPSVALVAGFFTPDACSRFEIAMGATVLPALSDIRAERFLPSSRSVAFRKGLWERVGGYPEWLDYGEDLVFDLAAREAGAQCLFVAQAIARFRPRATLRAYWHQYFCYARGDGKAALWPRRHAIRYLTYAALIAVIASGRRGRAAWPLAALGVAAYLRRPFERYRAMALPPSTALVVLPLLPIIRLVGDLAKMCGYPAGFLWRLRYYGFGWTWRDALATRRSRKELLKSE